MREKIEEALARIRPMLGTADVRLVDVNGGIVTVQRLKQLSLCDIKARGPVTNEIIREMLEEEIGKEIPEVKEVIVVGD